MGYKKKSSVWFLFFLSSSYPVRWRLSLSFILYFFFCLHVFFPHSDDPNKKFFSSPKGNESPCSSLPPLFSPVPFFIPGHQSSFLTFFTHTSSTSFTTKAPAPVLATIATILHPLSLLSVLFFDGATQFITLAHAHRSSLTHKSSSVLFPPSTLDSSSSSSPSQLCASLDQSSSSCPSLREQESSFSLSSPSISSPLFSSFLSNSRPLPASILLTSPFSLRGNEEEKQKKTFSASQQPSSSSRSISPSPSSSFLSSCENSLESPRRTSRRCLWGSLPTAFLRATSQLKENERESLFFLPSERRRRREDRKSPREGQPETRQEDEGLLHTFTSPPGSVIATLFPSSFVSSSSSSSPGIERLLSIRGGFQLQVKTMSGAYVLYTDRFNSLLQISTPRFSWRQKIKRNAWHMTVFFIKASVFKCIYS